MNHWDQFAFHVTVAFRHGYGESFADATVALEYADAEMHRLLAEYEELEREDFEGIYCEHAETKEFWRFDHEEGVPQWIPERLSESEIAARLGATRQGAVLVVKLKPAPGGHTVACGPQAADLSD